MVLLVFAGLFLAVGLLHPAEVPKAPLYYATELASHKDKLSDLEWEQHYEAVEATVEAAGQLDLDAQIPTLLAMWEHESGFRPVPANDHISWGVAQTRLRDVIRWKRFWRRRGFRLPPFRQSIRTQCFDGVAEFWIHLHESRGDVKEAVRRYNGSGPAARRYAEDVMKVRARIFGAPYKAPELVKLQKP